MPFQTDVVVFYLITKVFTTKILNLYILHSAQNNSLFILFHLFIYLPMSYLV